MQLKIVMLVDNSMATAPAFFPKEKLVRNKYAFSRQNFCAIECFTIHVFIGIDFFC